MNRVEYARERVEENRFRKMAGVRSCRDLVTIITIRFLSEGDVKTLGDFKQINDLFGIVFLNGYFSYCGRKDYGEQRAEARR